MITRPRAAVALLVLVCGACGGARPVPAQSAVKAATPKAMRIVREPERPALAMVTRDGDPSPSIAAFVSTAGVAPARGAIVPVALAGLFASRLAARVTPQADGVRIVMPGGEADLAKLAAALAAPATSATDLSLVQRKVSALAGLARATPEEASIAACEGALVAPAETWTAAAAELESWRAAAVTREHVAFAIVGPTASAARAPALARGAPPTKPQALPTLAVYEDSANVSARTSRVAVIWRGDLRLLAAARALGDSNGSLAAMLAASDARAHVRSVTTALSSEGVCLSLRADLQGDPSTTAGAARLATLVTLSTRETQATAQAEDIASPIDASDAAEQAALVALASNQDAHVDDTPRVVVAVPGGVDATQTAIANALATAKRAWSERVVESKVRVERGQPVTWMLLASPCGTAGETDSDAGASAAFAIAAAVMARARGLAAEPWNASDGVGILASSADARDLADTLARTLWIDPIEGARGAVARLIDAARPGLAGLAEAISPAAPASILPTGTTPSLLRLSEAAVAARADALRHGPIRVAVLANVDAAQADAAAARVDRWVLREGTRSCPARAANTPPRPGTYAVQTDDGTSEAYVAAMIPRDDEPAATLIAGALDGESGLLEKALGDGLARAYGARVLGAPGARALVVHVEAPSEALDAAVAQVRSLFDRVRQGGLGDDDLARAQAHAESARASRMRDPRERLLALFRNEAPTPAPPLDRVRQAAASFLHDDGLVIVAARPRGASPPSPSASSKKAP